MRCRVDVATLIRRFRLLFNSFGGGSLNDIKFGGNSATNFSFPFQVNYSTDLDPQSIVLASLLGELKQLSDWASRSDPLVRVFAEKCGTTPPGDITINYDLTLKLHLVAFDVSPTISSSASLQCPVSAADIRVSHQRASSEDVLLNVLL